MRKKVCCIWAHAVTITFSYLDPTVEKEESKQLGKTKNFLDDDEIIANIILFFLAGFETTSSALVHTLFHLAQDQEIQNRLLSEIEEALHGLDITSGEYYDTVMTKISYLDACIKETLRLYPPLVRLERRVNTDGYNLGGVELENDQLVTISAFAIHRNPKYYPEPLTYNPERFMPENKHLLTPYTYLPFGVGSRNCRIFLDKQQSNLICFIFLQASACALHTRKSNFV